MPLHESSGSGGPGDGGVRCTIIAFRMVCYSKKGTLAPDTKLLQIQVCALVSALGAVGRSCLSNRRDILQYGPLLVPIDSNYAVELMSVHWLPRDALLGVVDNLVNLPKNSVVAIIRFPRAYSLCLPGMCGTVLSIASHDTECLISGYTITITPWPLKGGARVQFRDCGCCRMHDSAA